MTNIEFLYEELRKATDGGSESMGHEDALKQISYWRDVVIERDSLRNSLDAMKLANDAYKTSLDAAKAEIHRLIKERDALHDHIHTCGPTCSKAGCVNRRLREAIRGALELLTCGGDAEVNTAITQLRSVLGEGK